MKQTINIKTLFNWRILSVLVAGIILGALLFGGGGKEADGHAHEQGAEEVSATIYTCSMHPQIRQDKPGLCPICAMDLIPLEEDEGGADEDPNEITLSAAALKLAEVQTTVLSSSSANGEVILQGKVEADERLQQELTARFAGRIEKLWVNYTGQQVHKGQKLAEVYSPALISAQKELLDAAKYQSTSPALYEAARRKLAFWDLSESKIDQVIASGQPIDYFEITSPISGTVMNRLVSEGNYVKEGQALLKIADLSKVWVMLDAYENDLPLIEKQASVNVSFDALPGEKRNGRIDFIDPVMDPQKRITKVRVEMDNADGQVKPGFFANGHVMRLAEEGLTVPRTAVLWTGKRSLVYLKVADREKPTFVAHEIDLGPSIGDHYLVASGLSAGDEVVTYGAFKVDAAAQLAGKKSMMNPEGHAMPAGHQHGGMDNNEGHAGHSAAMEAQATINFPVNGACGMCKERIETAAHSVEGVASASWNKETKALTLGYNGEAHVVDAVKTAIALAGHDNDAYYASDEAYADLHSCCQYRDLEEPFKVRSLTVAGNCDMCQERIETAASKVDGVTFARWDSDTQKLALAFNVSQTNEDAILKAVAAAGHDNERFKALNEVYEQLPGCCQYERLK